MNAHPPIAAAPAKKRMHGCLIAVAVMAFVGAIAVVTLLVVAGPYSYAVYTGMRDIVEHGAKAPGVKELKETLCAQAVATDLDEAHRFRLLSFPDAGPRAHPDVRLNVACFVDTADKAPTCAEVASTYRKAAPASDGKYNVVVLVGRSRAMSTLVCSTLHAGDHTALGEVAEIVD